MEGMQACLADQVSQLAGTRVAFHLEVLGSLVEGSQEACLGRRRLVLVGNLEVMVACLLYS